MSYAELQIRALQIARTQIGVREQGGTNRGPQVEAYLRSVRLPPGNAWCQAFVRWCLDEAARELGIANPHYKGGGAVMAWHKALTATRIRIELVRVGRAIPARGSIIVWDHGKGKGHIGFAERIWKGPDGLLYADTVEGNTNTEGSREGDSVAAKERRLDELRIKGFIDYSRLDAPRNQAA